MCLLATNSNLMAPLLGLIGLLEVCIEVRSTIRGDVGGLCYSIEWQDVLPVIGGMLHVSNYPDHILQLWAIWVRFGGGVWQTPFAPMRLVKLLPNRWAWLFDWCMGAAIVAVYSMEFCARVCVQSCGLLFILLEWIESMAGGACALVCITGLLHDLLPDVLQRVYVFAVYMGEHNFQTLMEFFIIFFISNILLRAPIILVHAYD